MMAEEAKEPSKKVSWLKRGGIAVFLFFLIKGLIWLGIFVAAWFGFSKI